jgi:hypothetical protein
MAIKAVPKLSIWYVFGEHSDQKLTPSQRDTFKAQSVKPEPRIVIANAKDSYSSKAEEDGFGFTSEWAEAAAEADVVFLLVPDQVSIESLSNGFRSLSMGDKR